MGSRIATVLVVVLASAFLAVTPAGHAAGTAYVVSGGNISQYSIDANGRLSPLSPPTISVGGDAHSIVVSPDGKSAYVPSDGDGFYQYDADPLPGPLSAKNPPAVPVPA